MPARRLVSGVVIGFLLGLATSAQAQGLPAERRVKLDLSVEQAMLIVQALPLVGCQTVAQWAGCQAAFELLREIKRQAAEQEKK